MIEFLVSCERIVWGFIEGSQLWRTLRRDMVFFLDLGVPDVPDVRRLYREGSINKLFAILSLPLQHKDSKITTQLSFHLGVWPNLRRWKIRGIAEVSLITSNPYSWFARVAQIVTTMFIRLGVSSVKTLTKGTAPAAIICETFPWKTR